MPERTERREMSCRHRGTRWKPFLAHCRSLGVWKCTYKTVAKKVTDWTSKKMLNMQHWIADSLYDDDADQPNYAAHYTFDPATHTQNVFVESDQAKTLSDGRNSSC